LWPSGLEEGVEQGSSVAEIGNDQVRAHAQQAAAFPFIEAASSIVRLVAGHGQAADFLCVLNFHLAVTEREQNLWPPPVSQPSSQVRSRQSKSFVQFLNGFLLGCARQSR
jgi:hypothetical protein